MKKFLVVVIYISRNGSTASPSDLKDGFVGPSNRMRLASASSTASYSSGKTMVNSQTTEGNFIIRSEIKAWKWSLKISRNTSVLFYASDS